MKKPFALAVLAYLVPTFLTGFLWHLVFLHDAYARLAIYRPDPVIPLGFGSMLVQGLLFAWAYPRLFDTGAGAWKRSALRAGVSYAALSWSFTTLAVSAKHPMASVPEYVAIETAFTALQFLLVAPLMALAWRGRLQT
ncbi:MAG: hypothetical protein KF788_18690 [Piscinibacter sp.]|nr:hypothetical protein [Piscinibacter sp.]